MGRAGDIYGGANWFYGIPEHAKGAGDDVGWSMAGIGADYLGLMQTVGQLGGTMGATTLAANVATPIISKGLMAMMAMSNLCGFGEPDVGVHFEHGAKEFQGVAQELDQTDSPETWEGDASDAYDAQNSAHRSRAEELAKLDASVEAVVQREAGQLKHTRDTLDRTQTALGLSIPVAIGLKCSGPWGPAAATAFELAAVAVALPIAVESFGRMVSDSAHNATELRRAGGGYDRIAADAHVD
jgi:uncharacterized protein YukE